jgi:MoaA/NifB/PqqE/SkfB family radical SAM enzyme
MEYWEHQNIVKQAHELGARSIVIIGGGEPTIYQRFRDLISYIDSLDMIPVVITNGQTMDRKLTRFLNKHHASVLIKMDSLNDKLQDSFSGVQGSSKNIKNGVDNLITEGFCNDSNNRLGASCVLNRLNAPEIFDIWRFCRDRNIIPNIETMTPNGRAKKLFNLILKGDEVQKIKYQLLELDQNEYGYSWNPHTPLFGAGCRQLEYSLCITVEGYARPCAAILTDDINVRPSLPSSLTLDAALQTEFIQKARFAEKYLTGSCGSCDYKSNECIGCRGSAYVYGILNGLNPLQAIVSQDPFCNKELEKMSQEPNQPMSSICIG